MKEALQERETYKKMPEHRIAKITSKRQFTIPKDFYEKLGLTEGNVEIILDNNELKIKKYHRIEESHDNYADLVLESILDEGIVDKEELLKEFRLRMNLLPLAVQDLLKDVRKAAYNDKRSSVELDEEVFGDELLNIYLKKRRKSSP